MFCESARRLTTTQLLAVRSVFRSVINSYLSISRLFQRLQADIHLLQPIHLNVSASFAYRRVSAKALPTDPTAADTEAAANSFSALRLLIFFAVWFTGRYFPSSSSVVSEVLQSFDVQLRAWAYRCFLLLLKSRPELQWGYFYDDGSCCKRWVACPGHPP